MKPKLILTCEHATGRVPARYRRLFHSDEILRTHRSYDRGAISLAREIANALGAPLLYTKVSRLLVDHNRSLHNARVWSAEASRLPRAEREDLVARYYQPHRRAVEGAMRQALRNASRVFHVGVHSFVPELGGVRRHADVGLLYDPTRSRERLFCRRWQACLRGHVFALRVRRNYPYRGTDDGLTTTLRRSLGKRYLGIELEVSQGLLNSRDRFPRALATVLSESLSQTLR